VLEIGANGDEVTFVNIISGRVVEVYDRLLP